MKYENSLVNENNTIDKFSNIKKDISNNEIHNDQRISKDNINTSKLRRVSTNQDVTKGKFYNENYVTKRTKFSYDRKVIKFNIWTILKDAIGKDLNRFTMPGI